VGRCSAAEDTAVLQLKTDVLQRRRI
jgi:hypothetical protein